MFFSDQAEQTRQVFYDAWHKFQNQQPLSALEVQVVAVIRDHPEYHSFLSQPEQKDQNFFPEMGQSNPFLHMGLHLALREQVDTNRPEGIKAIYLRLEKKYGVMESEHRMIEHLAEALWTAQRHHTTPNEQHYLTALKKIR